jgi:hypothetical protein
MKTVWNTMKKKKFHKITKKLVVVDDKPFQTNHFLLVRLEHLSVPPIEVRLLASITDSWKGMHAMDQHNSHLSMPKKSLKAWPMVV